MNEITESSMVYDKHGRVMGVTIQQSWGGAPVPKSFCRSRRHQLVILFYPDHKKVCDSSPLLYKKCVNKCLDSRLNSSISADMQGLMVQSGIDSTKLQAC